MNKSTFFSMEHYFYYLKAAQGGPLVIDGDADDVNENMVETY